VAPLPSSAFNGTQRRGRITGIRGRAAPLRRRRLLRHDASRLRTIWDGPQHIAPGPVGAGRLGSMGRIVERSDRERIVGTELLTASQAALDTRENQVVSGRTVGARAVIGFLGC
jgi:hypothetical protein